MSVSAIFSYSSYRLHTLEMFHFVRHSKSTNLIESCFSRADDLCGNVKRWRNANIAWRWAGTVLLEAEKRFHRIKGYRQMPMLAEALPRAIDSQEAIA